MASTYTDGLAVEIIGSGDKAGSWGDVTNNNLKALEEGISRYAEVGAAGSNTSTLNIPDGQTAYTDDSKGRSAVIKWTGAIASGDIHTVTLQVGGAEATQARFTAINGLSSSKDLVIDTASGTSLTIPNGYSADIHLDGSGNVVNSFSGLAVDKIALKNNEIISNEDDNEILIGADKVILGDGTGDVTLESNGNNNLVVQTGHTDTGTMTIVDGSNGDISITPHGTGKVVMDKVNIGGGEIDGTPIGANSANTGAFTTLSGTTSVTTPSLTNTAALGITTTGSNGDITITPHGTGETVMTKVDINSGAIDGTPIGAGSASTGAFSTLSASGLVTATAGVTLSTGGTLDVGSRGIANAGAISGATTINASGTSTLVAVNASGNIATTGSGTITSAGRVTSGGGLNAGGTITGATTVTADTFVGALTGNAASVTNGVYTTNNLSALAPTTSAQLAGVISNETGSGALVFGTSPTLVTPALGTPASGVATNLTGTASGLTAGTVTNGVYTTSKISALASTTSSELAGVISNETGSGSLVFATDPVLVSPRLGTPHSGVMTNVSGTAAGLTAGAATLAVSTSGLKTDTSTVVIGGEDAPSSGMVLTAKSSTEADWQTPVVGDITDVLGGTNVTVASSGGPQPTVNLDAAISLTSVSATSITGSSVLTTPKLTAIGALSIQTSSNNNVTIAPNGTGTVQITGGQYLNLSGTVGSGGYGLRGTSLTLNASNKAGDGWGQVYHEGATSGQGVYYEATSAVAAGEVYSLTTGFESVPSIVTIYLECLTDNAGYVDGDHVLTSSSSSAWDVGNIGLGLSFDGSASDDLALSIGSGGLALIHGTTGAETQLTESSWQLRIKAWK